MIPSFEKIISILNILEVDLKMKINLLLFKKKNKKRFIKVQYEIPPLYLILFQEQQQALVDLIDNRFTTC